MDPCLLNMPPSSRGGMATKPVLTSRGEGACSSRTGPAGAGAGSKAAPPSERRWAAPPPPPRALAGHPVVRHLEPDAKPRRRQRRRGRRGCGTSRPNLGRWAAGGPSTTALALAVASLSSRSGPASRHYRPSGRRRVIGCECPQVSAAARARGTPGASISHGRGHDHCHRDRDGTAGRSSSNSESRSPADRRRSRSSRSPG